MKEGATNSALFDFLNKAPCGFHCLDKSGVFLHINDTELDWLGYDREEVVGKLCFRDMLIPDSRKFFDDNMNILIHKRAICNIEYHIVCKNKSILSVILNANSLFNEKGEFEMTRSVLVNISELLGEKKARIELSVKLQSANEQIKILHGLIPTCAYCKKVRDDEGVWEQMESYISAHSEAEFSHGICPKCLKTYFPEYTDGNSEQTVKVIEAINNEEE